MNVIYGDLKSQVDKEKQDFPPNKFMEMMLQDYEEGRFTYRTRLILFSTASQNREEYAFACATKDFFNGRINVYYISDAYNINTRSDIFHTNEQISARFICLNIASRCWLVALAEEAAITFPRLSSSAMYALQEIYQQMRKFHAIG